MGEQGGAEMIIILDFGSGNTCKNDEDYAIRMIDELDEVVQEKRATKPIIKWQLFEKAGGNIPLAHELFEVVYKYALRKGYQTTASVFDEASLEFLLSYDVPFVKIANNKSLYPLIKKIPRGVPVVVSHGVHMDGIINLLLPDDRFMVCISKYPTIIKEYEESFSQQSLTSGISDHTTDWKLYKKYRPWIYECHYKLEDSEGLDAGPFARTPKQLKEIL